MEFGYCQALAADLESYRRLPTAESEPGEGARPGSSLKRSRSREQGTRCVPRATRERERQKSCPHRFVKSRKMPAAPEIKCWPVLFRLGRSLRAACRTSPVSSSTGIRRALVLARPNQQLFRGHAIRESPAGYNNEVKTTRIFGLSGYRSRSHNNEIFRIAKNLACDAGDFVWKCRPLRPINQRRAELRGCQDALADTLDASPVRYRRFHQSMDIGASN